METKKGGLVSFAKTALGIAVGVAVGMLAYEQIKKLTAKA